MAIGAVPSGRRERAKHDKQARILAAARGLFAQYGVGAVTTQQVADRADVAIGTLYLYASTKAELLIMLQNEKFATAIDDGIAAAEALTDPAAFERVCALLQPIVLCIREHVENGRMYLHELVMGDPTEPYRRQGLMQNVRLQEAITSILAGSALATPDRAAVLARVITAILNVSTTASVYLDRSDEEVLADIRQQLAAILNADHSRSMS